MTVVEVKNPTDYELDLLLEEADESSEWMIRERVPYVGETEFNEHVTSDTMEARQIVRDILDPRVGSDIVYVEVSGESFSEDVLYDPAFERTLLNVSEETEQLILEDKPDDVDLDEYLQDKIQ